MRSGSSPHREHPLGANHFAGVRQTGLDILPRQMVELLTDLVRCITGRQTWPTRSPKSWRIGTSPKRRPPCCFVSINPRSQRSHEAGWPGVVLLGNDVEIVVKARPKSRRQARVMVA